MKSEFKVGQAVRNTSRTSSFCGLSGRVTKVKRDQITVNYGQNRYGYTNLTRAEEILIIVEERETMKNKFKIGQEITYSNTGNRFNGQKGVVVDLSPTQVKICWADETVNTYDISGWAYAVLRITEPETPNLTEEYLKTLPNRGEYLVWSPECDKSPKQIHLSLSCAKNEVVRLAKQTGKPFYWVHISGGAMYGTRAVERLYEL